MTVSTHVAANLLMTGCRKLSYCLAMMFLVTLFLNIKTRLNMLISSALHRRSPALLSIAIHAIRIRRVTQHLLTFPQGDKNINSILPAGTCFSHFLWVKTVCSKQWPATLSQHKPTGHSAASFSHFIVDITQ